MLCMTLCLIKSSLLESETQTEDCAAVADRCAWSWAEKLVVLMQLPVLL